MSFNMSWYCWIFSFVRVSNTLEFAMAAGVLAFSVLAFSDSDPVFVFDRRAEEMSETSRNESLIVE
jgi:hypothetical protein